MTAVPSYDRHTTVFRKLPSPLEHLASPGAPLTIAIDVNEQYRYRLTSYPTPSNSAGRGMLPMRNKFCSNEHRTQRFLDLGSYLICECCSKRLERVDRLEHL